MEQESPSPNQCYSKYTESLQYETIYTIYDMMPTTHIKYYRRNLTISEPGNLLQQSLVSQ